MLSALQEGNRKVIVRCVCYRERMKAMEQQIASLTGLVQHALFKGPNAGGAKEVSR